MSDNKGTYTFNHTLKTEPRMSYNKPINMTTEPEKPLSEVEKAQADVDRFTEEIVKLEHLLAEKKTYLAICNRSLKALLKAQEKFKK